ncbi:MAG: CRISPR-associated ring nuclease Csm6 [Stellaceae bacterium]
MPDRPQRWREVLIVTGGMTPQVVTETVFALARRERDPIVSTKIVCAVTGGSVARFGDPLALEAALARLKTELAVAADWQRRPRAWHTGTTGFYVAAPQKADGGTVDDIRSDADAVAYGDLVSEIVRRETLDPECRVHLSLAGGRKTMSFHGGSAMTLFARPQDELSHVLVHPADFEQCPDFWFPTQADLVIERRGGGNLNARDARIELALIPFIRVRDRLPPRLVDQAMDYASYVRQLNALSGVAPLSLELMTADCRVLIGDLADFTLPNTEFALYQLMAEWRLNNYAGASSQGIGTGHRGWMTAQMFEYPEEYQPNPVARFIQIYDETFKEGGIEIAKRLSANPETRERQDDNRKPPERRDDNRDAFREYKSRLTKALQARIHEPDLADRFGAPLRPIRVSSNRVVFGIRLDPREITIQAG